MMKMLMSLHEHQQKLDDKLNSLDIKMSTRMDDLMETVNNKLDNKELQVSDNVEVSQKRVEEKVEELMDTVKQQTKLDSHLVHDCVDQAVRLKLAKDEEEMNEIKRRRTNVIIHGLHEADEDSAEERKKQDETEVVALLHAIDCDDVSVDSCTRLGKKEENSAAKPRPIKLVVASEEQKDKILRRAKNLKGLVGRGLDKVFIHQDLTPTQREKRHRLVQELKERVANGETNLIIINDKIVTRRTRVD